MISPSPTRIYVDADACPVKDEIYRVAARHSLPVTVVANSPIRVPQNPLIERIAVGAELDAADNWIAERAGRGDIVITTDVPLASRCVKAGAEVIAPNGRPFTEDAIGMTLAVRNLMTDLRSGGRSHQRAAAVLPARPLGLPLRARPGNPACAARPAARLSVATPPPLIQLKDIALTFGGTPLLAGVELSVSAGERVCLVGRNGSGKSTLLRIAAGLIEPDRGTRFVQPGATIRYLAQEPDFGGAATTLAYVEAGLGPGDDPHQARYLLEQLGLDGSEDPARLSGGEARRAALARVLAPSPDILCSTSRPITSIFPPSNGWSATCASASAHRPHQPRSPLPRKSVTQHGLARSRPDAADRSRVRELRSLARRSLGGRGARAPQARPQDRRRGALAALRRDRAAQAQRAPARRSPRAAAERGATIVRPPATSRWRRRRPTNPARW